MDLELRHGRSKRVAAATSRCPPPRSSTDVLADGPMPLSKLRDRIEKDVAERHPVHVRFQRRRSNSEIESRGWYTFTAARVMLFTSGALLSPGHGGKRAPLHAQHDGDVLLRRNGVRQCRRAASMRAGIAKLVRRRRRTLRKGSWKHKRWEAFRRYLTDFPRACRTSPAASPRALGAATSCTQSRSVGPSACSQGAAALPARGCCRGSPIFWLGLQDAGHRRQEETSTPSSVRSHRSVAQSSKPAHCTYARRPMRAAGRTARAQRRRLQRWCCSCPARRRRSRTRCRRRSWT